MKRYFFLIATLIALLIVTLPAGAQSISNGNGDLRVMTYNVNEGTDYLEVQHAAVPLQFLLGVGQTITQVRATDPKLRMQYVAKQIIDAAPALVSLQELDQWASGPFNPVTGQCGAVTVEFDIASRAHGRLDSTGCPLRCRREKTELGVSTDARLDPSANIPVPASGG